MSGELIAQETIDALLAASAEARDVISEARGATRDLRQVVTEARALIRTETEDRVRELLEATVSAQLEKLGEATAEAMDAAVDKVGREFRRLERIYLGGEDGQLPLEAIIRKSRS